MLKIATLNILSNKSSNFVLAKGEPETSHQYTARYTHVIDKLQQLMTDNIDIILLQEVTEDFMEIYNRLIANSNPRYFAHYHKSAVAQVIIVNIEQCSIRYPLHIHNVERHNKIMWCKIHKHHPEYYFNLVNIHLMGAPTLAASHDRQATLTTIIRQLRRTDHNVPIIIIGDFNDDLTNLKPEFTTMLTTNKLAILKNPHITSYHRYNFDETTKQAIPKSDSEAWKSLDHIIYSSDFYRITDLEIRPKNGLANLETPYRHTAKGNIANYDKWPSDHALVIYSLNKVKRHHIPSSHTSTPTKRTQ